MVSYAGEIQKAKQTYQTNLNNQKAQLENEKNTNIANYNKEMDNLVSQREYYTQTQNEMIDNWKDKQTEIQQAKTDQNIAEINQQKDKAEADYTKEQKGAYSDYFNESNGFGVNAEQRLANGLSNSGYSEASKQSMFNAYQNRIASARQSLNETNQNFDNQIQDAKLANDSALAEIAYNALQQQTQLALDEFNYKSEITKQKLDYAQSETNNYYNRYQQVYQQLYNDYQSDVNYWQNRENTENEYERWLKEFEAQQRQFWANYNASYGSGGGSYDWSDGGSSGSSKKSSGTTDFSKIAKSNGWTKTSISMNYANTKSSAKKYGTFSNGYQPKGISGYGKLKKSEYTCTVNGKEQNVWVTTGGGKTRAWYWDGKSKTYVGISW